MSTSLRVLGRGLALVVSFLAPGSSFASPSGTNLLMNPSFETGNLTGWTTLSGSPSAVLYGTSGLPGLAVSDTIGGESFLVRDGSGNSVLRQVVPLGANPQTWNVRVGGFFGGGTEDGARMTIAFVLQDGTTEFGTKQLPYVTQTSRNFESVLMIREGLFAIPAAATSLSVRIEFQNNGYTPHVGCADALFAELTHDPVIPAPYPLGQELLVNTGFEEGWSTSSPLTLIDPQGWEGVSNSASNVESYSNANPSVPSMTVAGIIGGQARLLTDEGGNGSIRQRLDVRGNTGQFVCGSGPDLRVTAYLGGIATEPDSTRIDVSFLDASLGLLKLATLPRVTREIRNYESVLVSRVLEECVPATTAFIDVVVVFENNGYTPHLAMCDNISARLVPPPPAPRIRQGVNLVSNGGFEAGSLPGSPLELKNPLGWYGGTPAGSRVVTYGGDSVPSAAFATMNGLGGALLRDAGDSKLLQTVDLSADNVEIDQGLFVGSVSAWLGGAGSSTDRARVSVQFYGLNGVPVGPPQQIGPVTAADRGNATTLLFRSLDFPVPPNSRRMELTVDFINDGYTPYYGLADRVRLSVRDVTIPDATFCFGDGSATPCPCANSGLSQHGCANRIFSEGCRLLASGSASVVADELVLHASFSTPYQPGLFFQGNNAINAGQGIPFGDGLRCVGGGIVRLQTRPADPRGESWTTVSVATRGGVTPGSTKRYQWWYRDPVSSPCGSGYNLSNGVTVHWVP